MPFALLNLNGHVEGCPDCVAALEAQEVQAGGRRIYSPRNNGCELRAWATRPGGGGLNACLSREQRNFGGSRRTKRGENMGRSVSVVGLAAALVLGIGMFALMVEKVVRRAEVKGLD